MSSSTMPPAEEIDSLGHKIEALAVELQRARNNSSEDLDTENQLLDALDDLRAEIVGPAKWPGTFFAPPEFAAMQVAFQREIFQNVPLAAGASIHTRDLAALAKVDEDILLRIMRCLAANKIFVETDEKVFAHTPISAAQADEHVAARTGGILNDFSNASTSLAEAIDTGKGTASEARFGMPMYEYFEKTPTPDRGRMAKAMVPTSTLEREELATLVPWQDFSKVVEIGGGAGHLAATLTHYHSHLQAVNQDGPSTIADALDRISKMPPKEAADYSRVEFETYDYYTPQPRTDADAFVLRRCLHTNPDLECIRILKAVVPGLANNGPNARLLINEKLLPAWNDSSARHRSKRLRREDIVMMISVGGKERSLNDFEVLLNAADERFKIDQVYYGRNHFAVISVKLAQHDLDSTQIADTASTGVTPVTYGVTPLANGDAPINGEVTAINNGVAPIDNGPNQPKDISADVTDNQLDAVEEVEAGQHDLGSAQVAGIPLKNKGQDQPDALTNRPDQPEVPNSYLGTPNDASSAVTNNHSDVVQDLKAAQTDVLAS